MQENRGKGDACRTASCLALLSTEDFDLNSEGAYRCLGKLPKLQQTESPTQAVFVPLF